MDHYPPSQASSHFPLSPTSASALAQREVERRNLLREMGCCKSGCSELDNYVLQSGGFERGCVVGVSAEEESTGVALGLQVLSRELLDCPSSRALLVTPRPVAELLPSLQDSLRAQMGDDDDDDAAAAARDDHREGRLTSCLDRVMLSCIFDMDGLWEVLRDMDDASKDDEEEVQDSEQDDSLSASASSPRSTRHNHNHNPSVILITHFSTLLSSLFTQRDKHAAHESLALLSAHLRYLSRNLASNPLILLLNSVSDRSFAHHQDAPPQSERQGKQKQRLSQSQSQGGTLDASLQSIFSPSPLHIPGYVVSNLHRRTKPAFGLVFAQFLELHLLCSRVPRTRDDADLAAGTVGPGPGRERDRHQHRHRHRLVGVVTVVEVLMDDMGLWQGKRGPRPSREQRWTAVEVAMGRISAAM